MKDEVILELHIQILIFLSKKDDLVALKSTSFQHSAQRAWPGVLQRQL